MIVIVCSNLDENAKLLKAKWRGDNAVLLSVNDLTSQGWEISSEDFSKSKFVAEGKVLPVSQVEGIINILPTIAAYELFKIVEDDRMYVASELNAFLFYFFSKFTCPFLNKPSMFNLSGPFIKQEEWIMECIKAKMPVYPKNDASEFYESIAKEDVTSISYSNGNINSKQKMLYKKEIEMLAKNTGLNHFSIHLKQADSQFYFHSITTYPNVSDDQEINWIHQYFKN